MTTALQIPRTKIGAATTRQIGLGELIDLAKLSRNSGRLFNWDPWVLYYTPEDRFADAHREVRVEVMDCEARWAFNEGLFGDPVDGVDGGRGGFALTSKVGWVPYWRYRSHILRELSEPGALLRCEILDYYPRTWHYVVAQPERLPVHIDAAIIEPVLWRDLDRLDEFTWRLREGWP